ncbi:efflux RND transporter periplasmic adaptor subunit [Thalassospira sp. MCCC 1A01428]|uniref:efflux RND transporter periplasmic adaptor subunit n=1 Tax=Thalassospira sp. MCCC 1A01428 TaxID=1470575 RepID=UPI00143DE4FA|nr:efflux RND transporter periplasmic adaptor subunit [Thalassospira sp. MCCC 1A01428]
MLPITAFAQSARDTTATGTERPVDPYLTPDINMSGSDAEISGNDAGFYNRANGNNGTDATVTEARALVATRSRALLSAEIAARIADMPKRPGTRFAKGDVLVVFDCSAYRAQRAAVAADLRQANAQYKAQQRLAELRTVGELDVVMAQAAVERAKAQLQLQDVYLNRCKITAPYAGAVVDWHSQPYQTANPGDQLIEIVGSGDLELELIVPSQWLGWLKVGQGISAHIEETDSDIRARVARIGARIDPVSQTVKIYASLGDDAKTLLPGMSGRAVVDGHVSQ